MLQSVKLAHELNQLINDKSTSWNHKIASMYRKRIEALYNARHRQELNVLEWRNRDFKKEQRAKRRIDEIDVMLDELQTSYSKLFKAFQDKAKASLHNNSKSN